MRTRTSLLGLGFVSPALALLFAFFLMPVVLTTVFAFTNMSTSTGITGGSHVITGNLLRDLGNSGIDNDVITALAEDSFSVTPASNPGSSAKLKPASWARVLKTRANSNPN